VTGTVANVDLVDAHLWLPYSHAEAHSRDIYSARGYAGATRSQITVNSGTVTGCSLSNNNHTADCPMQRAVSSADNDEGTPTPPEYDKQTVTDGAQTVSGGSGFNINYGGSNSGLSESAGRSLAASSCASVLGNDLLPFQCSDASGPSNASFGFIAGPVSGSLLSTSASARATGTVDRTDLPSISRLTSKSNTKVPAIDVLTLSGAPAGYLGAARIGAADVTATANSGNGAAAPSISGAAVTVQLYDTAFGGYKTLTVTPGTATSQTAAATFSIGGATVSITTTATAQDKVLTSTSDGTGAITHAEASIPNWLDIVVHIVITSGATTHADLTLDLDYGRLATTADYQLN
jgi:hypothetical protein